MRRYYLQSGLWMGVLTVLIFGGLYVAADLNATDRPSNTLNIDGGFWSDIGTGFASDKMSDRSKKIAAGSNANTTVSLDLITDGRAGNQIDDGVTSGTVSGQGTKIAVEVFTKGVTTPLQAVIIKFNFDASVLKVEKVENSAFSPILDATGVTFLALSPVTLPPSGFLARAEFSTVTDVTSQAFILGIATISLQENSTSKDDVTTTDVISFNANNANNTDPSADFDGNGVVGVPDFLQFVDHFGTSRGGAGYDAKYDLDGNGTIGVSDFLIFVDSFGKAVSPSGGGGGGSSIPDLIVESPSVSDSTLTTRQSFTLSATVRNQGTGSAASTTLRYYRSSDATISTSDTAIGTDGVNGLSALGTSAESISLNAPSSAGTYYYGACVNSVTGESDTGNNCSDAVTVTVSSSGSGGGTDYDIDNDGLIEIANLTQLDAIRYDPDGDGVGTSTGNYVNAFPNASANMGCLSSGCIGYELTANLDFDTNGNGAVDAGDAYWNEGQGWEPILSFAASFEGNSHVISRLYIDRASDRNAGLFGSVNDAAEIRNVGLNEISVIGGRNVGGLVGYNRGTISGSYATGSVATSSVSNHGGGLVGANNGTISGSYATGSVATSSVSNHGGGLVGANNGTISSSYATGSVATSGVSNHGGGLVGANNGTISGSYATGSVTTSGVSNHGGGLVGFNVNVSGTIRASYWDTQTSGQSTSAGGEGKTTRELQSPTSNTGIYATWDNDVWDFGTSSQYPVLKNLITADTTAPTVTNVAITSRPASGDTYVAGETIEVTVTFSERVYVTGVPAVSLAHFANGGFTNDMRARYATGSGSAHLVFRYVVTASDIDLDGVSLAHNPIVLTAGPGSGTVRDSAGNAADRSYLPSRWVRNIAAHKVDGRLTGAATTAPTVTNVAITSRPASGDTYVAGETIEVTVTFSELVYVTGVPAVSLAHFANGGSTNDMRARYATGSGSAHLVFRYVVTASDIDLDGVSLAHNPIVLTAGPGSGTVRDSAGNAADRSYLPSRWVRNIAAHKVDGRLTGSGGGGGSGGSDDHGNTRPSATSLSLGSSRSGQIETGSDVDYFRVQVSGSGTLTVYTTGSLDTQGELQSDSGSPLTSDDDGGSGRNFRIERSVSSGTYYIKVESYGSSTGTYTIHARFSSGGGGGGGTSPPSGDAVTGSITTCSATENGFIYDLRISGTVRASRSVSNLLLRGYIGSSFVGITSLGSMSAGQSKNFTITGISGSAPSGRCRVEMTWLEGGNKSQGVVDEQ